MFCEGMGYSEKIIKLWEEKLSIGIHKGISIFCVCWICIVCGVLLLPALKNEYEKN